MTALDLKLCAELLDLAPKASGARYLVENLAEQLKAALDERKWLRTLLVDALQTMKGVNAANEDQANPARKCSLLLLSCIRDALSETEATR